jgi:hypothetical protein
MSYWVVDINGNAVSAPVRPKPLGLKKVPKEI